MEIYRIKDYVESNNKSDTDEFKSYLDNIKFKSKDVNELVKELEQDKSYHQIFIDNKNKYYTLFCDVDKMKTDEFIKGEEIFKTILVDISEYFGVDIKNIKYTLSKNKDQYSSHISIPELNANLKTMREMFEIFKDRCVWGNHIDLAVYRDQQLFRLPNQSNKQKESTHTIIKGQMIDFLNMYIPENSQRLKKSDIVNPKIKKTKDGRKEDIKIKRITKKIKDDQLIELLNELTDKDSSYVDDYDKWLNITTMLKNLDKFDIWDEWSKKSDKYNRYNNHKKWNKMKPIDIDLRYLFKALNRTIKIDTYKEFKPINKEYPLIKNKTMCNYRLYDETLKSDMIYNLDDLINNDTIILKSCTGTGKTTANAKLLEQYMSENTNIKLLTIISRVSLGDQLISSFDKEGIKIRDYRDNMFKKGDHYNVCLNSIQKLNYFKDEDIENYIVYIDEINSFIKHITHNITINKNLYEITRILTNIIKKAHKVIVSDAEISDGVMTFLNSRINEDNQTIMINNTFQKYKGIKAYRVDTHSSFKNRIEQNIINKDYFLFGCDSCRVVETIYYYMIYKYDETLSDDDRNKIKRLIEYIENKQDEEKDEEEDNDKIYDDLSYLKKNREDSKFRLYTSNVDYEIKNASKEFKDKYVFYSPSITTAIDFSIDKKQDVFIYIKGLTIDASESFQQLSRTRNIRDVYYFCNREGSGEQYETLEDVDTLYSEIIKNNDIINHLCSYLDDNDNVQISRNTFYKLFIYNEYVKDIYQTCRLRHFENILKDNGFELLKYDTKNNIEIKNDIEFKINIDMSLIINESIFMKYLDSENQDDEEFNELNSLIDLFKLPREKEILLKYKDIFINEHYRTHHFNLIRFFKNDEYIDTKIKEIELSSSSIKCYNDIYHKIKILRKIQKDNNLSILNLNKNDDGEFICDNWDFIAKKIFRSEITKPKTRTEFNKIHISFIKNIIGHQYISSKQPRVSGVKTRLYEFDRNKINEHIELNKYISNNNYNSFSSEFRIIFDIEEVDDNIDKNINQDDEDDEDYIFKCRFIKHDFLNEQYDSLLKEIKTMKYIKIRN